MADEGKKIDAQELDELGDEMEAALKNIGQDIPTGEGEVAAAGKMDEDSKQSTSAIVSSVPQAVEKIKEDLQFILDIPFDVTVEVGRSEMVVKDVVNLGQGSVIELDRLIGETLDVVINGRVIGQGDVVVVNDKFGLRLKKVITPQERIEQLRS